MTSPESIVTDLEHARMLKEAGWPQYESVFVWESEGNNGKLILSSGCALRATSPFCYYAAPTASELLHHIEAKTGWDRQQSLRRLSEFVGTAPDRILSNDVAEWWCYLAKNGLLPKEA